MNRQKLLTYGLMIFIVLIAFTLRVYRLGSDASFSTDEVTTITNSMRDLAEIPKLQNGTPLQVLWIGFGARVLGLGYSEFAVYLLSVIVGVLTVVGVFLLGSSLFDNRVGLLSAFMLAFSTYHIYWSRSGRYYALMTLLSIVSFLCLYWALLANRKRAWLAYALFRTLSLYDHLTAIWILAGEGVFALAYVSLPGLANIWKGRHEIRLWRIKELRSRGQEIVRRLISSRFLWLLISMALILLAYAPVWYPLLRDIYLGSSPLRLGSISTEQLAPRNPRTGQPQSVLGGGWRGSLLTLHLLAAWITPVHVGLIIFFGLGVLFCALRRQWMQLLFVLTIMVTPFILAAQIKSYTLVLDGRYLISLLPLYLTMAARGVNGVGDRITNLARTRWSFGAYAPLSTALVFAVVYAGFNMTRIPLTYRNTGQNWRAVSQFLAQNAEPDQLIIVHGVPTLSKALQYYLPEHRVVEKESSLSYDTPYQEQDGFWLVFHPGTDMYTGLRYWLDEHKAVSMVFAAGWYPEIDQTTDLAPGQNWDLHVVYASKEMTSTKQILDLHRTWLAEAEAHNPEDVRRHLTLAEAYKRFDRCDLAVSEYSLALDEGYVNDQLASYIYDAKGRCWNRLGESERAIVDWKRAIALADWSEEPYELLEYIYTQLGMVDEARVLYQEALQANPEKAWPHVLLGNYYRRRGLSEQAIAEYGQAIDLEPGDRSAYQQLGEVYAAGRDYARVLSLYQDAVRRNPWSGWPHLQLGQFYQSIGQVTEAVAEYQRAVDKQAVLAPAVSAFLRDARWNLATALNTIQTYSDQGELLWSPGNSWVKPYPNDPDVLVGHSELPVSERSRPNQLFIHPFSDQENTYIEFEIPDNPFAYLQVGYALADEVAGLSNGVEYLIEVRKHGNDRYEPLLDLMVDENIWDERTASLLPYFGEDLQFRLVVSARDDYAYDWLQTTVELLPPPYPVWDLSTNLGEARFSPDAPLVEWRETAFYTPDGSRLAGLSDLPVEGRNLPGQVMLHPYSSEVDSILTFSLPKHPYRVLKTWFGLADEALADSNGVDYTISVSVDGGQSFFDLVQTTVTDNTWGSILVDLPASQDIVLKVGAAARQDIAYDWLQVVVMLVPLDDEAPE